MEGGLGSEREAGVAFFFAEAGIPLFASRDEEAFDFTDGTRSFAVGGVSKVRKRADYVIRDDTDLPAGRSIPYWTLAS